MSRTARAEGAPLGPGSLLWSTAGDPRSLLTGSTAGLLQLMLPSLGAGVTDHSDFFDDPFDRIFRSIPLIWGTIFSDDDEGESLGHRVRDFHPDIKGTDHRGNRYHALDPDTYWWAHATFTWEMFRARDLYFAGCTSRAAREQLYAESVTWYRRYGVSDRPVPLTLDAFEARFDEICRTELELTPAVQWVLDPARNSAARVDEVPLPSRFRVLAPLAKRSLSDIVRLTVYGALPDVIRHRFDLPWSNADRVAFALLASTLQAAGPAVQRGALSGLWPEGTPHLAPGSTTEVIVAGPSIRQRRRVDQRRR